MKQNATIEVDEYPKDEPDEVIWRYRVGIVWFHGSLYTKWTQSRHSNNTCFYGSEVEK